MSQPDDHTVFAVVELPRRGSSPVAKVGDVAMSLDSSHSKPAGRRPSRPVRVRPILEALEDRLAPATFTVSNVNDAGAGSLRQAVLDANAAAGADTIAFDSSFNVARTISLTSGELRITDALTVTGPGAGLLTVRRDAAAATNFRVVNVDGTGVFAVTLSDLTISGGRVDGPGGGVRVVDESVTVANAVVTGNSALGQFAGGAGGGIVVVSGGALTVRSSTISGNSGAQSGGGLYFGNGGSLLLEGSTISGNTSSGDGGGLLFFGNVGAGGATIRNSTISGNTGVSGGGVANFILAGNLLIQNSTISNNTATSTGAANGRGGGGMSKEGLAGTTVTLTSTIVAGNTSAAAGTTNDDLTAPANGTVTATFSAIGGDPGAGVLSAASASNLAYGAALNLGALSIANGGSTATHALGAGSAAINTGANPTGQFSDQRGPGYPRAVGQSDVGAIEYFTPGTPTAGAVFTDVMTPGAAAQPITVTYSDDTGINVATLDNNDLRVTGPNGFNVLATFVSVNPAGNGTPRTATYSFTPPGGNWDGADIGTYTVAMEPNQVADTAGNFTLAVPIGAFRVIVPATFVVTNANDAGPGSLRQAILNANANSPAADTITFDPTFFNTPRVITLTTGQLAITESVTITGPGATLANVRRDQGAATPNFRIFLVSGPGAVTVTMSGLTISGGRVADDGGGVFVADETVTIFDCVITGNTTTGANTNNGGGLFVGPGGSLTVRTSTVSANTVSGSGGGIGAEGNSFSSATATLLVEGCTIDGNSAAYSGGGVYFTGQVAGTCRNTSVWNNTTLGFGGGFAAEYLISVPPAVLVEIIFATIFNNRATGHGGGLASVSGGTSVINIVSSIMAGNTSVPAGTQTDDLYKFDGATITATFSAIGADPGPGVLSPQSGNNLGYGAALNLQAPANNGGPTQTIALGPGSAAINAGSNPAGLAFDQRGPGYPRVVGPAADIGAFEVQAPTAPRVSGTQINGGAAQRSRVTSLTVTFNAQVTFAGAVANAFTLVRISDSAPVTFTATANVVGGVTVVTLDAFTGATTESTSLADGRYRLTALAAQITANGVQLDGNNDGTGGDNFVLADNGTAGSLFRYYGDTNGDRVVDGLDFFALRSTFNLNSTQAGYLSYLDFNGDNIVDGLDFFQFRGRFNMMVP